MAIFINKYNVKHPLNLLFTRSNDNKKINSTNYNMSGDNPYLNLRNALKKNYSSDWEYTERDRLLFNENEKDTLWESYENGQVMLEIKREEYDINLYVHYYTEKNGKKYSEERRPQNTNFSDF